MKAAHVWFVLSLCAPCMASGRYRRLTQVPFNACDGLDDDPFIRGQVDHEFQCRRLCVAEALSTACVFDELHGTCAVYTVDCAPIQTSFRPPAKMFAWR